MWPRELLLVGPRTGKRSSPNCCDSVEVDVFGINGQPRDANKPGGVGASAIGDDVGALADTHGGRNDSGGIDSPDAAVAKSRAVRLVRYA